MEPSLTPNRTALKVIKRTVAKLELVETPGPDGNRLIPVLMCNGVPHVLMPIVNIGSKRLQAIPLSKDDPLYLALVKPAASDTSSGAFEDA